MSCKQDVERTVAISNMGRCNVVALQSTFYHGFLNLTNRLHRGMNCLYVRVISRK
jgi:hypothetical protein